MKVHTDVDGEDSGSTQSIGVFVDKSSKQYIETLQVSVPDMIASPRYQYSLILLEV